MITNARLHDACLIQGWFTWTSLNIMGDLCYEAEHLDLNLRAYWLANSEWLLIQHGAEEPYEYDRMINYTLYDFYQHLYVTGK